MTGMSTVAPLARPDHPSRTCACVKLGEMQHCREGQAIRFGLGVLVSR